MDGMAGVGDNNIIEITEVCPYVLIYLRHLSTIYIALAGEIVRVNFFVRPTSVRRRHFFSLYSFTTSRR